MPVSAPLNRYLASSESLSMPFFMPLSGPFWRLSVALLLVGWALAVPVARAATAADQLLYTVGVDVQSRSLEDRRKGASAGLEVMLIRLSGLTTLPKSQALASARRTPDRFFTQYRYYATDRYDELGQPLTQLSLQFSPQAMRALMSKAQLPLWTLNRPKVAVWLAERSGNGTDLIEDPTHPLLAAALRRADYRGLPTVVPGLAGVSATAVWNRDQTALRRASERVDAELLLVGRAEQLGPDEWQVRWTTWSNRQGKNLTLSGSVSSASDAAVDMVTNTLVSRFTVAGGAASMLQLIVENVSEVDDYAQLLKYLSARSFVKSVSVAGLAGDELTLDVSTTSSPEKFMRLLAVDSRLIESTAPRRLRSLPATNATIPVGPDGPDFGSRTAVAVPEIVDAQLRVAWQG